MNKTNMVTSPVFTFIFLSANIAVIRQLAQLGYAVVHNRLKQLVSYIDTVGNM